MDRPFYGASRRPKKSALPSETEAELRHRVEGLILSLPAVRAGSAAANIPPMEAHCLLPRTEREALERTAASLHFALDDFLLAAVAALLSRLAGQDTVSIARVSQSSSVVTFRADGGCSFEAMAQTAEATQVSRQLAAGSGAVSYQFLEEKAPAPLISASGLAFAIGKEPDGLRATLSSDIWDAEVLEQWLRYLRTVFSAVAGNPALAVNTLPLLNKASVRAFYTALNQTAAEFPREQCVHDLIARQAALTPDAIAVISDGKRFSYRELEERSTKLAQMLVSMGAGSGRPVAICMERSADVPLALLAVLKSGSCYVPLDLQNPHQRLMTMIEECRPVAILSNAASASELPLSSAPVVCVDKPWPESAATEELPAGNPDALAYIIYTSGTTGRPKGVMIAHRSLTNLLCAMSREPGFSSSDRMLAVATISFDMAVLDVFLPLISGGTVVVADRAASADPNRLAALLEEHDITVLQATPVTWRMLLNSGWRGKPNLKMLSGGEALPRELANTLLERGGDLWNCYGPTETTIYAGNLRIVRESGMVPIGGPIANTSYYVMDAAGCPVPEGVPGELYIGGMGVSRGYLKRPELTEQRFLKDPEHGMLFRTGDLVRIAKGGELEFFGRLDHQVKLRGYRIELGEIESVLRMRPEVANAVVVLREDTPDEPRLVAYVTWKNSHGKTAALRAHAAQILPDYMLPQRIVALGKMPLTSTGKIDRRALPLPEELESQALAVEPQSATETKLLTIFREVLGERSIGVTDNFFEFGGYSLVAVKLFARIKHDLQLDLPISLLFDAPTVRALARIVDEGRQPSSIVPIRPKGSAIPLFVVHSYLIYGVMPEAVEHNRPVFGLREVGRQDLERSFHEQAEIHAQAIAKVYPDGPVCLAGWCAAGPLTVEIASHFSKQGRQIGLIALFDSECPGYVPQFAGNASQKTKLLTSWKRHLARWRRSSLREKAAQVGGAFNRRWERLFQTLYARDRARFLWLKRNFGFIVPAAILANNASNISFPAGYQWDPVPGTIVLFRPAEPSQHPDHDETLGWKDVAAHGVQVEFVPGDHESMFKDPNLKIFGQKLRDALQESAAVLDSHMALPS